MRSRNLILSLVLMLCGAIAVNAQAFDNPKVEYTFDLPSPGWHLVSDLGDAAQGLEFINGSDRNEGLLVIRKIVVEAGTSAMEAAKRDQDQSQRYRPGFVDGKQNDFAGRVNGVVATFEYTSGGKPMAGLIYYLQTDNRTIYTLRFTGRRDKLALMRNQTDVVARSFKLR